MLNSIVKKEILNIISSWRFFIGLLTCLLLSILMLYVRNGVHKEELTNYIASQKTQEERVQKSFNLNWPEYSIYRKPSTLYILCEGISMDEAYEGLTYGKRQEEDPFKVLFSQVDLPWIIGVVISLVALIFAHDTISGEREAGTLSVMFSNPLPKYILILGKWLGGVSVLSIILLFVMLLTLIFLLINPMIKLSLSDFLSFFSIGITSIFYLSLFYILGIVISIKSHYSSGSLLSLLLLWCIFVGVIPNLTPDIAHLISNTPSENIFKEKKHQIENYYREEWAREFDKHREIEDEEGMLREVGAEDGAFRKGLRKILEEMAKLQIDFNKKVKEEISLSVIISSISPFASFYYLTNDLSNTGMRYQEYFSKMAESYYKKFFVWYEKQLEKFYEVGDVYQFENPVDTTDMPRFKEIETGFKDRIQSVWFYFLIIFLYNILFLVLANFFFVSTQSL